MHITEHQCAARYFNIKTPFCLVRDASEVETVCFLMGYWYPQTIMLTYKFLCYFNDFPGGAHEAFKKNTSQ